MLLKKTLQYKELSLKFDRTELQEGIDKDRKLVACKMCGFYSIRTACKLKYQKGLEINKLKCGFDYFYSFKKYKWTKPKTSYAYVAQEKSDM